MKMKIFLFLMVALLYSVPNYAVKPNSPTVEVKIKEEVSKQETKEALKLEKKQKKIVKRFQKIEKRLAKKGIAKGGQGIWDNENFRLGAYVAVGGLILRIFSFIPLLGGIFSLIGSIIFLVGLGIMIWALID